MSSIASWDSDFEYKSKLKCSLAINEKAHARAHTQTETDHISMYTSCRPVVEIRP